MTLKKKNMGVSQLHIKSYFKASVIKKVWYWLQGLK